MVHKYFDGEVSNQEEVEAIDQELLTMIDQLEDKVEEKMQKLEIGAALDEIFNLLRRSNKYIDETLPWALAKDETKKARLATVLYHLLESIRVSSLFLASFLPDTATEIQRQLNTKCDSKRMVIDLVYTVSEPKPLFLRIDKEKKLQELGQSNNS